MRRGTGPAATATRLIVTQINVGFVLNGLGLAAMKSRYDHITMCGKHSILLLTTFGLAFAQTTPPDSLKFEVISIRTNKSASERSALRIDADRLSASNVSARSLIETGYGLKTWQISGAPDWLNTERFDVEATAEHPVTRVQIMEMLRSLLAERFGLSVHRDSKDIPVFALTVAKGGLKLTETAPDDHPQVLFSTAGPMMNLTGLKAPLRLLTPWLTSILMNTSRPVVDQTGLAGTYDFKMEWLPDNAPASAAIEAPSIYSAMQEQLGLRLNAQMAPFEILMIDHIERPSSNQ